MTTYRLYCLDGVGKIVSAEPLEASSDDEAMNRVRDMEKAIQCEVWERNRLVGKVAIR